MVRINILPIMRQYIEDMSQVVSTYTTRQQLLDWLKGKVSDNELDLAADCMIAAGFGEGAEQDGTVFGFYSYG